MAEKVLMLALSPTMEEGVIVKWLKNEGDSVGQGDILCEIETDKATMEYESPAEGTLLKIIAREGQAVPVGRDIAVIGQAGEDISELIEETPAPAPAEKAPVEKARPVREEPQVIAPAAEGRVRSSPLARKLAKERGIDLSTVQGSGPQGRITRGDVDRAASGAVAAMPPEVAGLTDETVPVTQKRKVIADTLSRSKFTAPHYYLRVTAAVDNLMQARTRLNDKIGQKVSVNAFLMKFVAETLKRHPMINATWQDDTIVMHGSADIALAVAQPDGLIAPVVRNCNTRGVLQIDRELKTLIEKTRKGALSRADYADSTFTVSSLGTFGIEEFTAIINPPNSAILAVGEIMKIPVAGDDDRIGIARCMKLTLSCDHRIIDGTVGAAFLGDLKEMIEYPVHELY